ncbi:hypothetical protein FOA52_000266 [Chlamydomonas sp. UWO 241]|nr:hypothetical protein FOA52_000266 [Chlamydomonas sp. UWO 241]
MLTRAKADAIASGLRIHRVLVPVSYQLAAPCVLPPAPRDHDAALWRSALSPNPIDCSDRILQSFGDVRELRVLASVAQTFPMQVEVLARRSPTPLAPKPLPASSASAASLFRQVHVRRTPLNAVSFDLQAVFSSMRSCVELPFAKLVTPTDANALFKVSRDYINRVPGGLNRVGVWLDASARATNRRYAKEMILLKVHLDAQTSSSINVVVFADGTYDIKLRLPDVASLLPSLSARIHELLADRLLTGARYDAIGSYNVLLSPPPLGMGTVRVMESVASDAVGTSGVAPASVAAIVQRLRASGDGAFHVIGASNGGATAFFKRTNAFASFANVMNMMNRANGDARELRELFGAALTEEELQGRLETWRAATQSGYKQYYRVAGNVVTVTVSVDKAARGYRYRVENAVSADELARVAAYLHRAMTDKGVLENAKRFPAAVVDRIVMEDDDLDFGGFDEEGEGEGKGEGEEEVEDEGDEDGYAKVVEMKLAGTCPQVRRAVKGGKSDVLQQLQKADRALFGYKDPQAGTYALGCQASGNNQPNVLSNRDLAYNEKCFPGAVGKSLRFGSTPALAKENSYTCPTVWCPKSRVALTQEQYERYGSRCPFPGLEEEPVLVRHNRYINAMGKRHPTLGVDVPCCKKTERDGKKTTADELYVLNADVFPTPPTRLALLPPPVYRFFGKQFCGGDKGLQGAMKAGRTDCLLRAGIDERAAAVQPLTGSLVEMGFAPASAKTSDDFIRFVFADGGRLFRRFAPGSSGSGSSSSGSGSGSSSSNGSGNGSSNGSSNGSGNGSGSGSSFAAFQKWLLSEKAVLRRFDIEGVVKRLKEMTALPATTGGADRVVRRFYRFYVAYLRYAEYLANDDVPKHHDAVLPMYAGNAKGVNLVVVESGGDGGYAIQYKQDMYVPGAAYAMILNNGRFYEPIVRATLGQAGGPGDKQVRRESEIRPDHPVARLVSSYMDAQHAEIAALEKIVSAPSVVAEFPIRVIDFDMRVVALASTDHRLLPLPTRLPCRGTSAGGKTVFVDTFFDADVRSYALPDRGAQLDVMIRFAKSVFAHTAIVDPADGHLLTLERVVMPVPIGPEFASRGTFERRVVLNGATFDALEVPDERSRFIDARERRHAMYVALFNELVALYHRHPALREEIDFLRNPENPLPRAVKYAHLGDLVVRATDRGEVYDAATNKCRVALPAGSEGDYVLQRTLHDILNLSTRVERKRASSGIDSGSSSSDYGTISFASSDSGETMRRFVEYALSDRVVEHVPINLR